MVTETAGDDNSHRTNDAMKYSSAPSRNGRCSFFSFSNYHVTHAHTQTYRPTATRKRKCPTITLILKRFITYIREHSCVGRCCRPPATGPPAQITTVYRGQRMHVVWRDTVCSPWPSGTLASRPPAIRFAIIASQVCMCVTHARSVFRVWPQTR